MRLVVILLLLANVALFALTRLDAYSVGEGQRLGEQVQPDKIKVLTPQEVDDLFVTLRLFRLNDNSVRQIQEDDIIMFDRKTFFLRHRGLACHTAQYYKAKSFHCIFHD